MQRMLFNSQESLLARIQRKQLPNSDMKFNRACGRQSSKMASKIPSFPPSPTVDGVHGCVIPGNVNVMGFTP